VAATLDVAVARSPDRFTVNLSRRIVTPTEALPSLSFYILLALHDGPAHGWGIIKRIREITEGQSDPSTGSLYLAMTRLSGAGLIAETKRPAGEADDPRRRYYKLTAAGRATARAELFRLEQLVKHARQRRVIPQPFPEQ
jgi:DNA-binding PadR family transcriptional regulator